SGREGPRTNGLSRGGTGERLLFVIAGLRGGDAVVLRCTGHRIAFFLGDLVFGVHLVLGCVGACGCDFLSCLRIRDGLRFHGLRFLDAVILVVAAPLAAFRLGDVVVGLGGVDLRVAAGLVGVLVLGFGFGLRLLFLRLRLCHAHVLRIAAQAVAVGLGGLVV